MNYVAGDLRDQLVQVGSAVVGAGLVVGSGGNLSAREPGADDIWVTATGTWLDRLDRSDFCRVSIATGAVAGGSPPPATGSRSGAGQFPTSELALHLETYRARRDVNAIVHLHPQNTLLLDALDEPIRLITTDHAFYLRRVARTPYHPPGTAEVARVAADASADGTNCVILARHGCSVLADTVELAHKRALYLEEAALLTFRAVSAGLAHRLPATMPVLDRA
ncbi:L-fuculose phosphate aldolase [Rugosimonospora acidiphila]|uniref:L-fuculose phosphate aldolase n=1 Tax=Rugosimonospora acidiphila TaxID=556531 RepID=A0ABP9RHK3_9ACTN